MTEKTIVTPPGRLTFPDLKKPDYSVELNGARFTVVPVENLPVMLTTECLTTTSRSGEKLAIKGVLGSPLRLIVQGEKLAAEINFEPQIQEALLHILRENAE